MEEEFISFDSNLTSKCSYYEINCPSFSFLLGGRVLIPFTGAARTPMTRIGLWAAVVAERELY